MKMTTKNITISGLLAAIASVIMFLELNLPLTPTFLKIDFSDVPALLGALAISPLAGVCIMAVKNLIHLLASSSGGVGELANFFIGCCFILPPAFLFRFKPNNITLITGMLAGIVVMTCGASLMNYYVLLPMYATLFPMDAIIQMGSKVNPLIHSKISLVLYGVAPFNVVKGLVNSLITLLLLKYLPKSVFTVRQ